MAALRTNSIDYVRLEGAGTKKDGVVGRFNDDPDVAVFLLHTLSQGAGELFLDYASTQQRLILLA